jgi:hypothetical protein
MSSKYLSIPEQVGEGPRKAPKKNSNRFRKVRRKPGRHASTISPKIAKVMQLIAKLPSTSSMVLKT